MIRFQDLSKTFSLKGVRKTVADGITCEIPNNKSIALLGRNGAGKSSLLSMLSGSMDPDSGQIGFNGTMSWPVGFAGSFHNDLSGAQNARFVARVYGVDSDSLVDYVGDFAELGGHYHLPFRTYSSGMRSRLAFGVSMGIPFDTYLIDEVTSVGDAAFRKKCNSVLTERLKNSGAIVVSHSLPTLRLICEAGMVLEAGKLKYFEQLEDAITAYEKIIES